MIKHTHLSLNKAKKRRVKQNSLCISWQLCGFNVVVCNVVVLLFVKNASFLLTLYGASDWPEKIEMSLNITI